MERAPDVLYMPLEVWSYVGCFMSPRALLSMSATCHRFRTALNYNSVWRRHTRGGHVSHMLEEATSIVQPVYALPDCDSLDPLCDQRLQFSKQSRLLHNLRLGKCVEHGTSYYPYIPGTHTRSTHQFREDYPGLQQITYKSDYLFIVDYDDDMKEWVIRVDNIKEDPKLVMTFRYKEHGYATSTRVCVVGDKLVVIYDDWFQVYEIDLPLGTFPLLYSVNMNESRDNFLRKKLVLNNFVVALNRTLHTLHVWDINTREKFDVKRPRDGVVDSVSILDCNKEEGLMLLAFQLEDQTVDVHIYNINLQEYTPFFVHLPLSRSEWYEAQGVVKGGNVVLRQRDSVNVYDCETSMLIVKKTGMRGSKACIVNHCLVLSGERRVKVFNLSDLKMLYELAPNQEESVIYRMEHCIHVPGLCNLIIMVCQVEIDGSWRVEHQVWDFENKQKLFKLPSGCNIVNDSFSKFISVDWVGSIDILSFW